ncbi:MAG: tetratricopeptide repeat protein [Gammaproteobacteria bacterium]|nr:tetratricopeptide repeat protein [Gammaproteobacteria bacterium]
MDSNALENMLEQGQDNALLRYTLGTLCLKKKRYDDAVLHLEQALKMNPRHSASWKAFGKALSQAERPDEAITAYREGISVAQSLGDIQAVKEMEVFLRRLEANQS